MLKGKTIFVTGGSRGIGKAITLKCAEYGANLVIGYQSGKSAAQALVQEIEALGGQAMAVQVEVTDRASVNAAFASAAEVFHQLDGLVNNAGINNPCDFDQLTDEDWDRVLNVNLKGPFICSQEALPYLKQSDSASIVNIGSVSGQYGGPRTAHYACSKAGLISLTQVVARFGATHNIRANTVAAGFVESEMAVQGLSASVVADAAKNVLLQRQGKAEEIAESVAFLLSDKSSYTTAQTINVNGGLYF